jgi:hypothetical protein
MPFLLYSRLTFRLQVIAPGDVLRLPIDEPASIIVPIGGVITVSAATVFSKDGANQTFSAPTGQAIQVPAKSEIGIPGGKSIVPLGGSDLCVIEGGDGGPHANMFLAVIPALFTMFGIGFEVGLIGELAVGLSDASTIGHFIAFDIITVAALFVLYYSIAAIRASLLT